MFYGKQKPLREDKRICVMFLVFVLFVIAVQNIFGKVNKMVSQL